MTEFSAEQIKDVQLMNTIAATEELVKQLGDMVKHIGNDISASLEPGARPVNTEELEHWLELCGHSMQAATKAIQINDIGYQLVRVDDMDSEETEALKAVVKETEPYKNLLLFIKETPDETLIRLIGESLNLELTREELDMLSGK